MTDLLDFLRSARKSIFAALPCQWQSGGPSSLQSALVDAALVGVAAERTAVAFEAFDRRVSELLAANNAEVERRRLAERIAAVADEAASTRPIRTDDAYVQSILHLPRCRDCADKFSVCDDGLPCNPEERVAAVLTVIDRLNYIRANPTIFAPYVDKKP